MGAAMTALIFAGSHVQAGDPNSALRFPGEFDRFVVLGAGAILIGGMMLIVNALRRRADRKPSQE
jgi:hypothetical protein